MVSLDWGRDGPVCFALSLLWPPTGAFEVSNKCAMRCQHGKSTVILITADAESYFILLEVAWLQTYMYVCPLGERAPGTIDPGTVRLTPLAGEVFAPYRARQLVVSPPGPSCPGNASAMERRE